MEETLKLIKAAQGGDTYARDKLVAENSGLIWSIVKKFYGRGTDADDLFQIGCIGLLKCINKFDDTYNVKFSTYAVPMIMGEIKRFLRDDGIVKISRTTKEVAKKAKYAEMEFVQKNGKEPTVEELAQIIGVSPPELVVALESAMDVESLSQPAYQGDSGTEVYLIDKIASADEEVVDKITLKEIITHLPPTERQIILMRYFKDKTQVETARAVGISQVQVSRIEKRALGKMRAELG